VKQVTRITHLLEKRPSRQADDDAKAKPMMMRKPKPIAPAAAMIKPKEATRLW
jgi:hypothetical protein